MINICFLTDDGYAMPTCVAINSLLNNKNKETKYNIYILCMNVSQTNVDKFMELNRDNFKIKIIVLDDKYTKYYMKGVSASPTAIYKFSIPEILNDLDKVIYLDGDIIINQDLAGLYNYDIGNNYVGVVKDINGLLKRHLKLFIRKNIFYFNSGVMLMNLKKMREDKMKEKLIDYRMNGYNELMDQDALNFVLRGNTYELPFKFNTQTMITTINKTIEDIRPFLNISSSAKSFDDLVSESIILHYSLKDKPWKGNDGYKFDLWLSQYKLSPYKEILIQKKENDKKKNRKTLKNLLKNYRRYNFFKKFSVKEANKYE